MNKDDRKISRVSLEFGNSNNHNKKKGVNHV